MAKADFYLLFASRFVRLFSYGALAIVFFIYLESIGLSPERIGYLLTGIIFGDLVITLFLTTRADRFGRKNTLALGAILKLLTGVVFASTNNFFLLLVCGVIGVISTSGGEIGPFIAVEQAGLTQLKKDVNEAEVANLFGWYNCFGYFAQAAGSISASGLIYLLKQKGYDDASSYRSVIYLYAVCGLIKLVLYLLLSPEMEAKPSQGFSFETAICFGIKRMSTLKTLIGLSFLFALDAFAGGFVMQTFISYWFNMKWGFKVQELGWILMVTNVINGLSGVVSAKLVARIGAVVTMVVTHLPSNVLLMLIPLMPTKAAAVLMLYARFCISQMDVPARQAYVALIVDSDERSAAGGLTNVARSLGLTFSPALLGYLIAGGPSTAAFSYPFIVAGVIKIVYDCTVAACYWKSKKSEVMESQGLQQLSEQQMEERKSGSSVQK